MKKKVYCRLCGSSRFIDGEETPQVRHWIQVALTTVIFTLATYPLFEFKGLVAFVPFWAGFEWTFRIRKREQLVCHFCGFDPVLYQRDQKRARTKVETTWAHQKKLAAELNQSNAAAEVAEVADSAVEAIGSASNAGSQELEELGHIGQNPSLGGEV